MSDAMVDLVQEGFDAALRTGKPQDSSLIGRRLGYAPRYLLAAPSYLAQHPPIEHPQQLQQHRCIAHRARTARNLRCGDDYYRWQLPLAHTTDNLLYARECAIAGAGITLLPAFLSREVVAQKLLVEVLPAWRAEGNELYLVYPSRKLNSPALACFIDVVLQHPAFDDYARELGGNKGAACGAGVLLAIFLYLMRCGSSASAPSVRFLYSSYSVKLPSKNSTLPSSR